MLEVRVYYEDTDLGGVVYHANYLKFMERARSEMLRAAGVDQAGLKAVDGLMFVVADLSIRFRAPARYDDLLHVETRVRAVGAARLSLGQDVRRADGALLTEGAVEVACVAAETGRPTRLPSALRAAFARP